MFSTMVGSALHEVLPPLQPAHGKITRLRVYRTRLDAHFGLAFASATCQPLNLATYGNSPAHSSKGTPSLTVLVAQYGLLRRFVGTRFQVLFHSPPGVLFTFPSRY